MLAGMQKVPEDEYLEYYYYEAIKDHKSISRAIGTYDERVETGIMPKSYQYLLAVVERSLMRKRRKEVDAALRARAARGAVTVARHGGPRARNVGDARRRQGKGSGMSPRKRRAEKKGGKRPRIITYLRAGAH